MLVHIDVDFQMLRRLANVDLAFKILMLTSDWNLHQLIVILQLVGAERIVTARRSEQKLGP